jgi:hypothetical protein
MDDAEFESLRLAFSRPAKKKVKSSLPRQAAGDPSDVNGYLGPWAPRTSAENDVSSGPSEVRHVCLYSSLKFPNFHFYRKKKLPTIVKLKLKLSLSVSSTSIQAKSEPFCINNRNETISDALTCMFHLIWTFDLTRKLGLLNASHPKKLFTLGLVIQRG